MIPNDKIFLRGFCIVTLLLVVANLWPLLGSVNVQDGLREIGFPLVFYREGGFSFQTKFKLLALGSDLVLGLNIAMFTGYYFVEVFQKK